MKRFHLVSWLSLLSLLPAVANAQNSRAEYQKLVQEALAASTVIAKGSTNPEAIPYGEKMAAAFHVLRSERLRAGESAFQRAFAARYGGSASDLARLGQHLLADPSFNEEVSAQEEQELATFCRELEDSGFSMAAIEIATRMDQIEDNRLDRLAKHYRTIMDELLPSTRVQLVSHIESAVIPGLTYGRIDYLRLAAEAPEFFQTWIRGGCERGAGDRGANVTVRDQSSSGTDRVLSAE